MSDHCEDFHTHRSHTQFLYICNGIHATCSEESLCKTRAFPVHRRKGVIPMHGVLWIMLCFSTKTLWAVLFGRQEVNTAKTIARSISSFPSKNNILKDWCLLVLAHNDSLCKTNILNVSSNNYSWVFKKYQNITILKSHIGHINCKYQLSILSYSYQRSFHLLRL